jgi:O-antigen/teichoic acid export membrane protein
MSNSIDGEKGKERSRRANKSSLITLLNRGISIGIGLISIPLTAKYLGTERFGMWLTLSTFLAWVGAADLGLANSITNALATADGKENKKQAREIISSAFCLMLVIVVVTLALMLIIYPFISWAKIFNVSSKQAILESDLAVLIGMIIFLIRLPLSIPSRMYNAFQEVYIYQIWSIGSNLLSFVTLLIAIQFHAGLPFLLGTFYGVALLGDLFAGIYMFGWRRPWLMPNLNNFRWLHAKWLLKTGILMWLSQISAIVMFQTDLIVVAQLFGASEVSGYGVTLKLFSLTPIIVSAILSPLWGAYSEALSRNDIPWIITTFKKTLYFNLFWSFPLGIFICLLCPWIVGSWVSKDVIPNNNLLLSMFVTSIVTVIAHSIGILTAGLCEVSISAKTGIAQGFANIFLSITLGQFMGVAGVSWSSAICLLIFSIGIMGTQIVKKLKILNRECQLSNSDIL